MAEKSASLGAPDPSLAGRYLVTVDSPMGQRQGEVELRVEGTRLEGSLELAGNTLALENGVAGVEGFEGEGRLKVMLMRIGAKICGRREGDRIFGTIDSSMGSFAFEGRRL